MSDINFGTIANLAIERGLGFRVSDHGRIQGVLVAITGRGLDWQFIGDKADAVEAAHEVVMGIEPIPTAPPPQPAPPPEVVRTETKVVQVPAPAPQSDFVEDVVKIGVGVAGGALIADGLGELFGDD